jgi:DNA-3-methyladenine glycosylase I
VRLTASVVLCVDGATGRLDHRRRHPGARHYYDTEWGMPVRDERGLFERISLEAFQTGLSWATILHKRDAFDHFTIRHAATSNQCD